jgi:hypothetical protein
MQVHMLSFEGPDAYARAENGLCAAPGSPQHSGMPGRRLSRRYCCHVSVCWEARPTAGAATVSHAA